MKKISKLKSTAGYETFREWCLSICNYLLSVDLEFDDMVNGEYGIMSIIERADRNRNIRMIKALCKEIDIMLREHIIPDNQMNELNQLLKARFGHCIVDEIAKDEKIIQGIIARGIIRNDREFELVKRREEEIYDDDSQQEYAEKLCKLMSDYE